MQVLEMSFEINLLSLSFQVASWIEMEVCDHEFLCFHSIYDSFWFQSRSEAIYRGCYQFLRRKAFLRRLLQMAQLYA